MKFSENWLRTFVNPPLTSSELAHALTMAGLEVEAVEAVATAFDKVVIAEVLSVRKHPDADRLNICQVDTGSGGSAVLADGGHKVLQIVCGAANVRAGVKVPCALSGAQLPGITIRRAKVRGVESDGMLCSAKELGLQEPGEVSEGLLLLPEDAPVGTAFRGYYDLDDCLFTLKLTPNRADCLGLSGVAREVASITSADFSPVKIEPVRHEIDDVMPVQIDAPEACPLYCGRVIRGVRADAMTPAWMVRRLERSGLHSISVVVDITNYILLETGQPMHAFDLAKTGNRITVRYARAGESLQLLNGENPVLQPDMLLIADEGKPLALAGIMGGSESSVDQATTDIFLESAFFNPAVIAGKSFVLGFGSDSSHRFERGVDYGATCEVMERATGLVLDICGGKAGPVTEMRNTLPQPVPVRLRGARARRVLGIDLDDAGIAALLQRLQFEFSVSEGVFDVLPPTRRFDLAIEEDLIEELGRIYGYDRIPARLPFSGSGMLPAEEATRLPAKLRQILVARDYQEVINYAFVDAAWEADFSGSQQAVLLKNPISSQMAVMRSSLAGGLLSNLQFNLNRKQVRVRLFETGRCFLKQDQGYLQPEKLSGLCYGNVFAEQWGLPARGVDFYDVRADIEALCWPEKIGFEVRVYPALHPGKSAQITLNEKVVGWLGELHPRLRQKYGLPGPVVLFELDMEVLTVRSLPAASVISRFPPVRRDVAVIVAAEVSAQALVESLWEAEIPYVSDISVFDMYQGKGISEGKKSLAFRVLLQDTEKTLTDADTDQVIARMVVILENKFAAKLRS